MVEYKTSQIQEAFNNAIKNKLDNYLGYCVIDKPIIFNGKKGQLNEQYVLNNNFPIVNSLNFGGTIVANKGDIDVAIFKKEGWSIHYIFKAKFDKFLKSKGINSSIMGNDLVIDGKYKVLGAASTNIGNRIIFTVIHISFNPNLEEINNICIKKTSKIPKGLNEYGISQEEILNFIKEFEEKYLK